MQQPSIGRIVHYRLSDHDAKEINKQRVEAGHTGNRAEAGQTYPAMIVRTFGGTTCNLQVYLDGPDTYWATSRAEGDQDFTWCWPPRV